jgi:hypothetical protein
MISSLKVVPSLPFELASQPQKVQAQALWGGGGVRSEIETRLNLDDDVLYLIRMLPSW